MSEKRISNILNKLSDAELILHHDLIHECETREDCLDKVIAHSDLMHERIDELVSYFEGLLSAIADFKREFAELNKLNEERKLLNLPVDDIIQ